MNLWSKIKLLTGRYVEEQGEVVLRKYKMTGETFVLNSYDDDVLLFKIKSVGTFSLPDGTVVKKGDQGGWITSENCLSHNGQCWIDEETKVIDSRVSGDAHLENTIVSNNSQIGDWSILKDSFIIASQVAGHSFIQSAQLKQAEVFGRVELSHSRCEYVNIEGDVNVRDSELKMVHVAHEKMHVGDDALHMNAVKLNCENPTATLQKIHAPGEWKNVTLTCPILRVVEGILMEDVVGEEMKRFIVLSETEMKNVQFANKSSFRSGGENAYHQLISPTKLNPVRIIGKVIFDSECEIKGQVAIQGSWRLSNVKMAGSTVLKSEQDSIILASDVTMDTLSSIVVQNNPKLSHLIEINDIHLTDDHCYRIDSNKYAM